MWRLGLQFWRNYCNILFVRGANRPRQIKFIFGYLEKEYVSIVLSDAIGTLEIQNE